MQNNSKTVATLETPGRAKAIGRETGGGMIQQPKLTQARPVPINWHSGLSIFASEAFLKTAGDEYGWLGGFDAAGNLHCVLPYTIVRKSFFRLVRFRMGIIPWTGDLAIEDEQLFLTAATGHFRGIGADMIIPATANTLFRTYPAGAAAARYGTYQVNLNQPEDALWNQVHPKHRNKIRSAMKAGVQVRAGREHLDAAYTMVRETLKRSGLGFQSQDSLRRLAASLGENVQVFVAEHQGVIQGCAVIPFSEYCAYYVHGGSAPEPTTGAMNLLHWEAMRHFRALGIQRYDFVGVRINPQPGTKQEGLKSFKERFGGQLLEGYMWKYPFRPVKYFFYGLAVRLRQGGDIVDQEKRNVEPSVARPEEPDHGRTPRV